MAEWTRVNGLPETPGKLSPCGNADPMASLACLSSEAGGRTLAHYFISEVVSTTTIDTDTFIHVVLILHKLLQLSRANAFEPVDVTPDFGKVLIPGFVYGNDVLNPNAPYALVFLQHVMINVR